MEYTKPNLRIPMGLWGEVKVAAYRSGRKPVELVIECLTKEYGAGGVVSEVKMLPNHITAPKNVVVEEGVVPTKQCCVCRLRVKQWVYDKAGKPICVGCAEKLADSNP